MEIKLIGTDIDGVWTDAKMYYNDEGEAMKAFSTYDGMAVQILKEYKICMVSPSRWEQGNKLNYYLNKLSEFNLNVDALMIENNELI